MAILLVNEGILLGSRLRSNVDRFSIKKKALTLISLTLIHLVN